MNGMIEIIVNLIKENLNMLIMPYMEKYQINLKMLILNNNMKVGL